MAVRRAVRRLGVDLARAAVLGFRRLATDVERVLFALVADRALDLCSKLAAAQWATSPRQLRRSHSA